MQWCCERGSVFVTHSASIYLLVFLAPLTRSPLCCLMRRCGLTVNLGSSDHDVHFSTQPKEQCQKQEL